MHMLCMYENLKIYKKKYENKRKCIQLLALKITEQAKNHVVMKRILF